MHEGECSIYLHVTDFNIDVTSPWADTTVALYRRSDMAYLKDISLLPILVSRAIYDGDLYMFSIPLHPRMVISERTKPEPGSHALLQDTNLFHLVIEVSRCNVWSLHGSTDQYFGG